MSSSRLPGGTVTGLGTVSGVAIAGRSSRFSAGGLFLLTKPAKQSAVIFPRPGTEVEVRDGRSFIVARCDGCSSADDAYSAAYAIAQEGLDILTAIGHR